MTNRSYYTDGTDDPTRDWLQKVVRVIDHPEWGLGRVMRWYPAIDGKPARLRLMCARNRAPQVVFVSDIEIVAD